MRYRRMPIEIESPEQLGYDTITNNLSESSVADRRLADLGLDDLDVGALLLCYGDHLGDPVLRDAVAAGGDGLRADDVLVTPGAAAALFATATSMLDPDDHVVVVRTNYATNLETPRAIGADVDVVDLSFADEWQLDPERIAARVRPGVTRLISVTCPHNPTGTMFDHSDAAGARSRSRKRADAVLLVDETYRDLTYGAQLPMAASCSPRAISVASMSKAYGLPGVAGRLGRVPRPRSGRDAARGQGADGDLRADDRRSDRGPRARGAVTDPAADPRRRARPTRHRARLDVRSGRRSSGSSPRAVSSAWCGSAPRSTSTRAGSTRCCSTTTAPTSGPGHWFEVDDRHFRLGFGWPTVPELRAGLTALTEAARTAG